ncbi:telomeric repeat-binding factor 2-interacting protein 1 isoform X1 [Syngnathus acus]|uniref:telomeric repeat-binding factor 2-interacting protein 1 isoform X1 n=1 Tax=Syngnathus acus TaxID=161584 RepID=UPI001885F6FD|nr:telomeric repeat-binding factor 2-interacting protein 1 isoform X1 [Syngnathus acus]
MASQAPDVNVSPGLFVTAEGKPLSFYLRPGPIKKELHPLIKARGGTMCNFQKLGSILLIDPKEKGITAGTAHLYVSIQFIHDCVEKNVLLNLEDYRMKTGTVPKSQTSSKDKRKSPDNPAGRQAYSPRDDAAILKFVSRRKLEVKGNTLWKQMEKECVTTHSWQSMKARYKDHLFHKHAKDVEESEATAEDVQDSKEAQVSDSSSSEDDDAAANPQMDSTPKDSPSTNPAKDLTMSDLLVASEKGPSSDTQTLTPRPLQHEKKTLNDELKPEATVEDETLESLRPEKSIEPEPETDQPQAKASPLNKSPESIEAARTDDEEDALHVACRWMRKQFKDCEIEEQSSRTLLSSAPSSASASCGSHLPSSSPILRKTKLGSSSIQKEISENEPPSKRAKGESSAAAEEDDVGEEEAAATAEEAESQQVDAEQLSAPPQASPSYDNQPSESGPQQAEGEKKKSRNQRIIERATKEFLSSSSSTSSDSDSESSEDVFQTAPSKQLASLDVSPSHADSRLTQQEHGEKQTQSQDYLSQRPSCAVMEEPEAELDGESQEEDGVQEDDDGPPEQAQLEEDKRRIRELMKQTNQDLQSVVKALLKTSGDFTAALRLLSNPAAFSTRLWTRQDDDLLRLGDPADLQRLQRKHGEVALAKRSVFLKIDR